MSGIAFWGTPIGWQFLFTLIFGSSFYFGGKNYLEKVLEYHFWGNAPFSRLEKGKTFNFEATELYKGSK